MPASSRTNAAGRIVENKILLSIPEGEYSILLPHLQHVLLGEHETLHEPGKPLQFAHFINSGLISLLVTTEDGKSVEAGLVGGEGVAGIAAAVGLTRSLLRQVAVVPTDAFRVEAAVMLNVLKSTPHLEMTLSRYAVIRGMQIAQTVACNRLHHIDQRLARWLLLAQDRMDSSLMNMTHDFLAMVLGTNRPTVSYAAGILQRRKCIKYVRGKVKIINRRCLEASACECYRVIQQFDRDLMRSL